MYRETIEMKSFCEELLRKVRDVKKDTLGFDLALIESTLENQIYVCDNKLKTIKKSTIECGSYYRE